MRFRLSRPVETSLPRRLCILVSLFNVQGSEFRVQSSEFRVQGSKFRVQSSEFKVQGSLYIN